MKNILQFFSLMVLMSMTTDAKQTRKNSAILKKKKTVLKKTQKKTSQVILKNKRTENRGTPPANHSENQNPVMPEHPFIRKTDTVISSAGVFGREKICDYTGKEGKNKDKKSEIYGLFIKVEPDTPQEEIIIPPHLNEQLALPKKEMDAIKALPEAKKKERIKAEYSKISEKIATDSKFYSNLSLLYYMGGKDITKDIAHLWNPEAGIGEKGFLTAFYVQGSDENKDPVVMVHGGPGGSANNMLGAAADLSQETGRSVLVYTQRGSKESGASFSEDKDAFQQSVEDLDRVIDAARELTKKDKVCLFGHSFGTTIVNHYTSQHSEGKKVAAAVAVAPAPVDMQSVILSLIKRNELSWEHRSRLMQEKDTDVKNFLHEMIGVSGFYNLDNAVDYFNKYKKNHPSQYASLFDKLKIHHSKNNNSSNGEDRLMGAYLPSLLGILEKKLTAIKTPTLVIHGEKDMIPLTSSQRIAKLIPNAELQVIPETAHAPFAEKPEDFCSRVGKFLEKHSGKHSGKRSDKNVGEENTNGIGGGGRKRKLDIQTG